ncbi:V-type ATPase subunit [Pseudoflavonifractor sp. 524-17]|uniref:V-type ATPase subunit n=1 Tax=Pseudoflavonifractor sp. 524-17 TaxID=2304577 RepID=UPI001FACC275|nr:V-type ATPase subunit [Pseudoflavonifractor sp. 524-17]
MHKKRKDTDYLSISTRVRAMENRLLTRERMERMIEARTDEEAAKVLTECGYGELNQVTASGLDEILAQARDGVYKDMSSAVPERSLIDVFQMKYDYHNVKVLLKAEAMGVEEDRLLSSGGRYAPAKLAEDLRRGDLRDCSETFRAAAAQAKEVMAGTGDPQLADFLLDQAYFTEMTAAAKDSGSEFLQGYVRLLADAANLRSAVRAARMGKGSDFLSRALVPGGNVAERSILSAKGGDLTALFRSGRLSAAAELGGTLVNAGGGSFTAFERLCDNAVNDYLSQARRVPFGEHPVIGYLYAREAEVTAIRTILSGRMAGLNADTIRERLRDSYV